MPNVTIQISDLQMQRLLDVLQSGTLHGPVVVHHSPAPLTRAPTPTAPHPWSADAPNSGFYRKHHLAGRNGKLGVSVSTLDRMVKNGQFPRPSALGSRTVGWSAGVVERWLAAAAAAAAAAATPPDYSQGETQ